MNKILIVEDDKKLSHLIKNYLQTENFTADIEESGEKAIYRINTGNYFLIILDINLPTLNGLQICKMIRQNFSGYILILTALTTDEVHLEALNEGADDFIKKPVDPAILLARIKAILRRTSRQFPSEQLQFGQLKIDLINRIVKWRDDFIDLKPSEFDLLVLLAQNAGYCLSRNMIMQSLRGIDYDGVDRIIDLRISSLRNKLNDDNLKPFRIKTIRGKGYQFQADAWDE